MQVGLHTFSEPPDAFLDRLRRATASDKRAERKKVQYAVTATGAVVVIIASAILARSDWLDRTSWAVAAALVALAVFAYATWQYRRWKSFDLDDSRLASIARLVNVLRADVPRGQRLHVKVDFRSYAEGGRPIATSGSLAGGRVARYRHTWLDLRTALADGSNVRLAVGDVVKRKEKRKRRGTKIRVRAAGIASLTIRLGKQYGEAAPAAAALEGTAPWPGVDVRRLRSRGRVLRATLAKRPTMHDAAVLPPSAPFDGTDLLRALAWAYRGVAQMRTA